MQESASDALPTKAREIVAPVPEFERSRQCHLVLYALCGECAVRLMKDHFVGAGAFSLKFDDESLQLDDPKSSALMRC